MERLMRWTGAHSLFLVHQLQWLQWYMGHRPKVGGQIHWERLLDWFAGSPFVLLAPYNCFMYVHLHAHCCIHHRLYAHCCIALHPGHARCCVSIQFLPPLCCI